MLATAAMRARLRDLAPRVRSVRPRPGSLTGVGIVWGSDYVELTPTLIAPPAPNEVTVRVDASAVSPGTERAQYLRLPNTSQDQPPGYSVAGTVVAVGSAVKEVAPGDHVAAYGVPHTSVANVAEEDVYSIPAGVAMEAAALTHLGVIAGQGVEKARLAAGAPFAVIGAGLVGALAQRVALARGAGPATVIATSKSKEEVARRGGAAEFLVLGSDDTRVGLSVVIEAAGSPASVHAAIDAAGEAARVVLLGSPRGVTEGLSLDVLREKQLTLIGAHVGTLELEGPGLRRREALRFLDHLAAGLEVEDLTGEPADPREPDAFYRRLAEDRAVVGAYFDWSLLPDDERSAPAPALRVPNRLRRQRTPSASVAVADPFSDAEGMLRLALCGCGEIAVANAEAAASATNVRLAAAYDPQLPLAEDLARRFGGDAYPTFDAVLESDEVDAVFLCVPHHLHAPLAIQAAQAGKHVVVEKPPANDLAGAAAMVAAAEKAGVTLSVCFPHRYEPGVRAARHLIRQGALGELEGATIKLFLDKLPAYWLGGYTGRSRSDWRSSRAHAGGGILIMNVSHYLDLLRHLTDVEVAAVAAFTSPAPDAGEVEETASATLRLTNGAVGTVLGGASVRGEASTEFRLWGRDGHLTLEPDTRVFTLRALDGVRAGSWHSYGGSQDYDIRTAYLSRLATAIARSQEPEVSARDALAVQAVMEAAYRSAETGAVVRPAELLAEAGA